MSRLLGPPSETIRSVSERASALAADQIAGAGTMAPAATPVTDFRKSRRFIGRLQRTRESAFGTTSQGSCQIVAEAGWRLKRMRWLSNPGRSGPQATPLIAYTAVSLPIIDAGMSTRPFLRRGA